MAKLSTFQDDFHDTVLSDRYYPPAGSTQYCTVVNGVCNLPASQDVWKGLETQAHYDATLSSVSWAMTPAAAGNGAFSLVDTSIAPQEGRDVIWQYDRDNGNKIIAGMRGVNGAGYYVLDAGTVSITYNAAVHKYFKITLTATQVIWSYSTDGLAYTQVRASTIPTPFVFTTVKVVFGAYASATTTPMLVDNINITPTGAASTDTASFDNLNQAPVAPPPPPVSTADAASFDNLNQAPMSPPATPQNLVAVPLDTGAALSWTEPTPVAALLGYTLRAFDGTTTTTYALAPSAVSTQLGGLTNGVSYTITLVANSSSGSSPAATVTVTPTAGTGTPVDPPPVTPSIPDAPQLLTATPGDGAAACGWTQPNTGGSPLTQYILTAHDGAGNTISNTFNPSALVGSSGPLVNGVDYVITVVAWNANGPSIASNALTVTPAGGTAPITPPPPPDPPTNLSVVPGDTTAIVSWLAPTNSVATLSGYLVVLTTDAFDDVFSDYFGATAVFPMDPTITSMLLSGLTDGVVYQVQVYAQSNSGQSVSSGVVSFSPVPGNPVQEDPNPGGNLPVAPPEQVWPSYVTRSYALANASMPTFAGPPSVPVLAPVFRDESAGVAVVAGQVQLLYLEDTATGEILPITPSGGGIWLNDLDLGYPTVREVITNWPGAHGTIDETTYYGDRAVTLSATCIDGADAAGQWQSASGWADTLRGWTALGRRIRIGYQLLGQAPRRLTVRTSTLGAPILGSGTGRSIQAVTLGWKAPDPFLYAIPAPDASSDPARDGYFTVTVFAATTGGSGGINFGGASGINFNGATGINFGGGAGVVSNTIVVPDETVGTVPVAPIITIYGGCTAPKVALQDENGVRRAQLEFSNTVSGSQLILAATDIMVIDVQNRTALRGPDAALGIGENLYKFLNPSSVAWDQFLILPQAENYLSFYPVSSGTGSQAVMSYRQAFV